MINLKLTSDNTTSVLSPLRADSDQEQSDKIVTKGIAVLELFTSEGCSSCPPADELIGKIQQEYQDDQVYVLAYHVNYWDHQGWKDIYSNSEYADRQYDYAGFFNSRSVYTPQVVINGQEEYIGSDETVVRSAIKNALATPASAQLNLKAILVGNKLEVNYTTYGISKNTNLSLALIQKSAETVVKRGENAHRTLSHVQIVRDLQSTVLRVDGNGSTIISVPKDFNTNDYEVVGFLQNFSTGAILGASKADISFTN